MQKGSFLTERTLFAWGFRKRWEKEGKFPESGDIIRMEYFRKNPEKKV